MIASADERTAPRLDPRAAIGPSSPTDHVRLDGEVWFQRVQSSLRLSSYRLTGARIAVLTWIAEQPRPFSAEAAAASTGRIRGSGSRSTIYRLIQLLRDERWLVRVSLGSSELGYFRQLRDRHTAICLGCGISVALAKRTLEIAVAESLAGSGFLVQREELSVYGWCGNCRPAP